MVLIFRVEYAQSEWECERSNCKVDGVRRLVHNGELVWVTETGRKHWQCLKEKNRRTIMRQISGPDQLPGFHDLLLKDKLRVVKDVGWPQSDFASYSTVDAEEHLPLTHIHGYQKTPVKSWESLINGFAMPPPPSERKIGAQSIKDLVEPVGANLISEPAVGTSTSTTPHFEPIISFPNGPLPPLDFRFRKPHSTSEISREAEILVKISSYKESPTSIVGRKFRFNDGNRIWEASSITFNRNGWGPVTVEGQGETHVFDLEVILSMLKHGVLDES